MKRKSAARALTAAILAVLTFAAPGRAHAAELLPLPTLRIGGGLYVPVSPGASARGAFDALAGTQILWLETDVFATPLIGYAYEGGGAGAHLFALGADAGVFIDRYLAVSFGARGLIGSVDDAFGGGVRVVAACEFVYGTFRIEAGYEALAADGATTRHDLRATIGVDVLRLLMVPLMFVGEDL